MQRVMVDMSATLLHHGHIRLSKKAKELGYVVVALTTDEEIFKEKFYKPELNFNERKEILKAIRYVDEVVPSKWKLDEEFLDFHRIDFLIHGSDNSNNVNKNRLKIFPRTLGISSTILRNRILLVCSKLKERRS